MSEFPIKATGKKEQRRLLVIAMIIPVLSLLCLVLDPNRILNIILVTVLNFYLIAILYVAANRSDGGSHPVWSKHLIPTRVQAIVIFFSILLSIILCFANVFYVERLNFNPDITSKFGAVYISALSLTTLGFANIEDNSILLQGFMLYEIFSAIILFFGAFALLISRITNF